MLSTLLTATLAASLPFSPAQSNERPVSILSGTEDLDALDGVTYRLFNPSGDLLLKGDFNSNGQSPFYMLPVDSDYIFRFDGGYAHDGYALGIEGALHVPDSSFVPNEEHFFARGYIQPHLKQLIVQKGECKEWHTEFNRTWMVPPIKGSTVDVAAYADIVHTAEDVAHVLNYLGVAVPGGVDRAWFMRTDKTLDLAGPGLPLMFFDNPDVEVPLFGSMKVRVLALADSSEGASSSETTNLNAYVINPDEAPQPAQLVALQGSVPAGYVAVLWGEALQEGTVCLGKGEIPVEHYVIEPVTPEVCIEPGPEEISDAESPEETTGEDGCTCRRFCALPSDIGDVDAADGCQHDPWIPGPNACPGDGAFVWGGADDWPRCYVPKLKIVGPRTCSSKNGGSASLTLDGSISLSFGGTLWGILGGTEVTVAAGTQSTSILTAGAHQCGQCVKPVAAAVVCYTRYDKWVSGVRVRYVDHWILGPNTAVVDWFASCAHKTEHSERCIEPTILWLGPCDIDCK